MSDNETEKKSEDERPHTIVLGDKLILLTGPDSHDLGVSTDDFWGDKYLAAGYKTLYLQAYQELCEAVTGRKPVGDIPDEAKFKEAVIAFLQAHQVDLHFLICLQFGYCEKRDKIRNFDGTMGALLSIAAIIADFATGAGIASAVWLISSDALDWLCDCKKNK